MNADFARTLSLLRQEKQVSQRVAAEALGVSQALLSHYENGIREPGLAFVSRVCEYYQVSADFLLGRTMSRTGMVILDLAQPEGEDLPVQRKLIAHSVEMIFSLLAETQCPQAIQAAEDFLGMGIYILFRHLYRIDGRGSEDLFSVPAQRFLAGEARLDLLASEIAYVDSLSHHAREKGPFPELGVEALQKRELQYQALIEIIHTAGERVNGQIAYRDHRRKSASSP